MKARSENARQKAMRVLPVLIYYAQMRRTLTYGELGELTGDHHRSFRSAFGVIHEWVEDFAKRRGDEALPLAIIVVQQGRSIPGRGAITWRLRTNGLSSDVDQSVVEALFKDERHKIFEYPEWKALLQDRHLKPYVPSKKPIDELTKQMMQRCYGEEVESAAHRRLKLFISNNPMAAGLHPNCKLEGTEYVLPSLDRIDVMFRHLEVLYPIEVKSHEADEIELVRGLYQVVKYEALSRALQKDRNNPPLAHACLATRALVFCKLRWSTEYACQETFALTK